MSYFAARKTSDPVLAPELPEEFRMMLGYTVDWYETQYDEHGGHEPTEPVMVLITGVRWARNVDNQIQVGYVQFFMDRMDGTARWTEPFGPVSIR